MEKIKIYEPRKFATESCLSIFEILYEIIKDIDLAEMS